MAMDVGRAQELEIRLVSIKVSFSNNSEFRCERNASSFCITAFHCHAQTLQACSVLATSRQLFYVQLLEEVETQRCVASTSVCLNNLSAVVKKRTVPQNGFDGLQYFNFPYLTKTNSKS